MATVGERIKRARVKRGWSGEYLAKEAGYKQQSAISNLENRGGGTGGKKLPEIARALDVPLTWLIEGPDDGEIPFIRPLNDSQKARHSTVANDVPSSGYSVDASLLEAVDLFKLLRTEQRLRTINYMRELLAEADAGTKQTGVGESDPVPRAKAA